MSDGTILPPDQRGAPTFAELVRVFFKIGCLSFGGPAGQIALIHKVLVDEKKWIDEPRYFGALNFCTLLPGPEAMQLATYVGWRLHGVKGGLAAGLLFVIPGALVVLVLSMLYVAYGSHPVGAAILLGVKAAVLAIVVEALLRVAKRGLKSGRDQVIAIVAFIAIYFLAVPFPIIVAAAAMVGYFLGTKASATAPTVAPELMQGTATLGETTKTIALWLAIWALPLLAIVVFFGPDHVLSQIAWFFSKLAVVTFGGAYAVLAYMGQEVVQTLGWLKPGEMVDGLGLAETTPGPLILVTQFVGFLAASRLGGGSSPVFMGVLGAVVTLWATFAPCFLWIFAGAPYVERLNANPKLRSALAAVTAAVVGVILNLTVWFAWNVLFRVVGDVKAGPFAFTWPDLASVHMPAVGLAALAIALMFWFHRGIIETLGVCALAALALKWIGII